MNPTQDRLEPDKPPLCTPMLAGPTRRRTPAAAFAAIALLTSLTSSAAGCGRRDALAGPKPTDAAAPLGVKKASVVEQSMPEYLLLTGTLAATQQADIAANASGKVLKTFVERGQPVREGEMIALLDSRSAGLLATAARAQSDLARNQMELARRECARAQTLFDSGSLTQAEYDRLITQCQNSQYAAAAAAANQMVAAKNAGDASIRAPFAGVVGERYINVGEFVQPASRVASLYAVDPLRLEMTVPESAIAAVRPDAKVQFSVTAYEHELFAGTVRFISPNVRRASRDLVVEAVVPNSDGRLRPGMFAAARFVASEKLVPVVPLSALRKAESSVRVFAVVEGRAEERVVQLGEQNDTVVAVLRGLAKGDTVVDDPPAQLRDGARVE